MPMDKLVNAEDAKKKKRKAVNEEKRRLGAFSRSSATHGADWSTCTPSRLLEVVVEITKLGGAVTVGLSRDKGAHSLALLLDGERETLWFDGDADLDLKLLEVSEKLNYIN